MKNVDFNLKTVYTLAKNLMVLALVMFTFISGRADIGIISANVNGGYTPGSTSTVVVNVMFSSITAENADFIEIRTSGPVAGLSLSHGVPTPSPYTTCGGNKGMEMTATGPGWGTPMFINGNSQCGAFEPGIMHTFGIEVASDGGFTGTLGIEVRVVGDGNGETGPSEDIVELSISPIVCAIVCPDLPISTVPSGSCSLFYNVPPPMLTGQCTTPPANISGTFPVGETVITYEAQDINGNDISCSTILVVIDDEDPLVSGGFDVIYDLQAGECGFVVPQTFSVNENCIDPVRSITQNEDLGNYEAGFNCVGGQTKYLRVFDAATEDINTQLHIEEITFGVLESFGNPSVRVNIYRVNGAPNYANVELIATAVENLPNFTNSLYSIPISAIIENDETFAVEIVVSSTLVNGVIIGMNQGGESGPTYVSSNFCSILQPTPLSSLGYGGYSAVMIVEGYESSYIVVPVANSPVVGDTVYEGNNIIELLAVDASGNTTNITYQVIVNGFEDYISAIACNDEVQVSLDENCSLVVTADMVLEGGPYSCYMDYTVVLTSDDGDNYGDQLSEENIGQTLTATVTGPNGNSCWGKVVVEDKAPAPLECMDLYTACTGSTFPGSPIADMVTFNAIIPAFVEEIDPDNTSTNDFLIPVFGLFKSTVDKVSIRINVSHTDVSDLTAMLTGPDGTVVNLFSAPGTGCTVADMVLTMDNDAFNTYSDLQSACNDESPAISGSYQPQSDLGAFAGIDPNGDWILTILDTEVGDGGVVNSIELVITQSGGVIGFPTDKDIIFQTESNGTFTVLGLDACGATTMAYNDFEIPQDCSSPYSTIIQRTWNAEDENGNASEPCTQTIYVYRNGLETLMFPPNYDGIQQPALSCSNWADMNPPGSVTGLPSGNLCDNVQMFPYVDTKIEVCEGSYKLVRHFQLLEWCSGEVVEHNQIIKVIDNEGPELEEIEDVTISAGDHDCTAFYITPKPTIISDCSDEFTYELGYLQASGTGLPPTDTVYYDDNVTTNGNTFSISGLVFGDTWVRWRVFDECGNYTDEYFTITVVDEISPVAVCDEFTVVSVGGDGFVEVFATTFDDGSVDNCGIKEMKARKMTNNCPGTNTSFADRVVFCCDEVGQTIMVAFEVTDYYGNKNTCMVEVTVQDKLPPYITKCPADITLDCQADYSGTEVTGEPEIVDNCEVVSVNFEDNGGLNNCGVGVIFRTWTIKDKQGLSASCTQKITLVDDDPFNEDDITWPFDYEATTCNSDLSPENLPIIYGYPRYDDDNCSLVATVYDDKVFSFVDSACVKILREWTVIDWCVYNDVNPVYGEGWYTHLQVIKLRNTEAPEFTNCNATTADVYDNCEGLVNVTIEATDDCTPEDELQYSYQIDLYGDGIDALDFLLKGNSKTINRVLPIGVHSVSWVVEDKCGNSEYCEMKLTVKDKKKPTPYCLSSITTVVMNNNGEVAIWASDFDYGSWDNCTEQENLKFSFSSLVTDASRVFSCAHLPNGVEEEIQIELWVTDEAGNQDFCSITLILQDSNADVCEGDNGNIVSVSGSIKTENLDNVEGANVAVSSSILDVYRQDVTGQDGRYLVTNLPKGSGYILNTELGADLRNGVSTLDLVLIQRHILGLSQLDSPYKVIASDINNDGQLKSSDLLSLRKVILGIVDEFPNDQESWRFVPKSTTFGDASNPFPYTDYINLGVLTQSMSNQDMVAIKIGDVNGSASANLNAEQVSEVRSSNVLSLTYDDHQVSSGDQVSIPVYADEASAILGFQFTLDITNNDFVDVISGQLDINADNIGIHKGAITASWASLDGAQIDTQTPLFTLVLRGNKDAKLSEMIEINSTITFSESYDMNGNVNAIELSPRASTEDLKGFVLYQNRPNPFMESTDIHFYLPEAQEVELMITNAIGKVILLRKQYFEAGNQHTVVNYSDLNASGIMYYTVRSEEFTATKKMINVR